MAVRTSEDEWRGDLKGGQGEIKLGSGAFSGSYSFHSGFEDGQGTNPEELIAAGHAGCFSMALSAIATGPARFSRGGFAPWADNCATLAMPEWLHGTADCLDPTGWPTALHKYLSMLVTAVVISAIPYWRTQFPAIVIEAIAPLSSLLSSSERDPAAPSAPSAADKYAVYKWNT